MDLLEYLWNAFDFTITLRLQTFFFFFLLPCFLEYLESNVLYLSKCSPVEYLAIFECIASLKIRFRDSLGKWEAWASDCRCKIWLLRIAWVHVAFFWKKVGRDHSQCFPDPLTLCLPVWAFLVDLQREDSLALPVVAHTRAGPACALREMGIWLEKQLVMV